MSGSGVFGLPSGSDAQPRMHPMAGGSVDLSARSSPKPCLLERYAPRKPHRFGRRLAQLLRQRNQQPMVHGPRQSQATREAPEAYANANSESRTWLFLRLWRASRVRFTGYLRSRTDGAAERANAWGADHWHAVRLFGHGAHGLSHRADQTHLGRVAAARASRQRRLGRWPEPRPTSSRTAFLDWGALGRRDRARRSLRR